MSQRIALGLMVWLACQSAIPARANQDALARAKDLYLSAAYDEALAVLDRLETDTPRTPNTEIAEYRVFCLLALNRADEARTVIEGIVNFDPFYHPSESQTSPRIRAVFQDARRAVLPGVVQKSYADAKAAFDKKDPKAAGMFDRVLKLLDDPDLEGEQLSDLRMVASGFRDLSKAVAESAPPPPLRASTPVLASLPPPTPPPSQTTPASPAPTPASTAPTPTPTPAGQARIKEPVLTPPVVISQPLPRWAPPRSVDARFGFKGSIEISIDENGDVTSAILKQSVHPTYDEELLELAQTWRYKPAMLNGVPRPYVKIVEIQLQPVR